MGEKRGRDDVVTDRLRSGKYHRLGVVADTHGLLREEVLQIFDGVECIVHAGDVGKEHILSGLETIAPVQAVRGNVDKGGLLVELPAMLTLTFGEARIHVLHNINDLAINPWQEGVRVIISGHSHRPGIREEDGILFFNPGSAGPKRFRLPVTCGLLHVDAGEVRAEVLEVLELT